MIDVVAVDLVSQSLQERLRLCVSWSTDVGRIGLRHDRPLASDTDKVSGTVNKLGSSSSFHDSLALCLECI